MSAAAPVRCPKCNRVVFAILLGKGIEGKCCGWRITADRDRLDKEARITHVDRPLRQLVESGR